MSQGQRLIKPIHATKYMVDNMSLVNRYNSILAIAIALLILLLAFGCDNEKAHLNKGHRWFERGNFNSAIKNYTWAISDNPSNPNTYFFRGMARLKKGESDLAAADFSKAIELDNTYVMAFINRGTIFKEKKLLDKALDDYNVVLKLKPDDYEAHLVRADLHFRKKSFKLALADYDILINNNYKLTNAYMGRGDTYYYMREYGESIKNYKYAIGADKTNKYAYNNLAWIYSTCVDKKYRDGRNALKNAEQSVKLGSDINNLHTLAAAYAENKMFEKAIFIMDEIFKNNNSVPISFKNHLDLFKQQQPLHELPVPLN